MDLFKLGCDVAVVGAGAAGLAAAIFTRRDHPDVRVAVFDGSPRPGAKILVSGGSRCNVTNRIVTERDFWGGRRPTIRHVLQALPVAETVQFFEDTGVRLHEEADGKLFPASNRARDVLEALLRALAESGAHLASGTRVLAVRRVEGGFLLDTAGGPVRARAVVLATGGRSLPKTGSDGAGYEFARSLGHSLIEQTPALAPLVLDPSAPESIHPRLSGTAVHGEVSVWIEEAIGIRLSGALLFTHFGVSGPLVLNASRHWARARLEGRRVSLTLNVHPGDSFETVERRWIAASSEHPRSTARSRLAAQLPEKLATAMLDVCGVPPDQRLSSLTRDDRRRLVHALTAWRLPVTDTRGYNYAEVTAGGVSLDEIDSGTMQSRVCPGLFLIGEILDVDGRIGGFNFQWAWASARCAARAIGLRASCPDAGRA